MALQNVFVIDDSEEGRINVRAQETQPACISW
jgi:hypothetical protein